MIAEFSKFAGFKVLQFFLFNPSTEIHVQGLAKKVGINAATSSHYCKLLAKDGLLNEKKQANLKLYSLKNNEAVVKELKKAFALLYLKENGIEGIAPECNSFAIYGSFANGSFDENSDLDLMVIGEKKHLNNEKFTKLQGKIQWEISMTIIPLVEWELKKKNKDVFALEVQRKHILLRGVEL